MAIRIFRKTATLLVCLFSSMACASGFRPTVESGDKAPGKAPDGMVWIPGGEFSMGAPDASDGLCSADTVVDARPILRVEVKGFWMDRTEVTNAEFAKFVDATGYRTIAEITPTKEEFPDAPPEALVSGAVVFRPPSVLTPLASIKPCTASPSSSALLKGLSNSTAPPSART